MIGVSEYLFNGVVHYVTAPTSPDEFESKKREGEVQGVAFFKDAGSFYFLIEDREDGSYHSVPNDRVKRYV